ncbi:MAG: ABC transporter ATP-binding protein [Acidobacteria bacterium]|nr:ABC transporter ATP-binding protein [Acidobacteriota bacterium]
MLKALHLSKRYETARGGVQILDDISLEVARGEAVAIMGPSGCGKSTLLYMLGALEQPSSGTVTLDGKNPFELDDTAQSAFRNEHVGFVFQDHLLLPQLSALDNVIAPTLVAAKPEPTSVVRQHATTLLTQVGLADRLDHRPGELSGGERQRVAIARALIRQPSLLLCDEPTGNLDRASADAVADLLADLQHSHNTMLVVVTHSPVLAGRFPRRYELSDRKFVNA